jgi:RNA polymerase sigma-70 factor, ECF subfamily
VSSHEQLVLSARGGDETAFAGLVELHWECLVRLARSVAGELEAEDVVQEGFIRAWRRLGQLRDPASFKAWMARSVLRVCYARVRRQRLLRPLEWVRERASVDPAHGEAEMESLLSHLPPRQRAVMHLTVVEGMSDSEIGRVLEIDAASVRSHRRRARERLRSLLDGRSCTA